MDLKNARIQEVPCLQLHTKFIYRWIENVAIDIINHYLKKKGIFYCVYFYHLEKAIDQKTDSLLSLAAS